MKVKVKAYAKINLMLDIEGKRNDGYHELFMIMQSVGIYDTVTVEKAKGKGITVSCNLPDIPTDDSNIVVKAAKAFFKAVRITRYGVHIDIQKRIPHAAGLAGGSADGAATLLALNKIYGDKLTEDALCAVGATVGADIPFCIKGGTLLAQGIGEILTPVKPLKRCYIVLAKPDFGVNTGKAYAAFDDFGKQHTPDKLGMLCALQKRDLDAIGTTLENVFEQFIEVPNRVDMKQVMRDNNAFGTCMSGSGPTVYGLFKTKQDAENAALQLQPFAKDICVCLPVGKGCSVIDER